MNPITTEPYKVSILVPVYGVEKYIERCAISLLEQTYKNIEYIFVNDCSKDNSIKLLEKLLEQYPSRRENVRIIHHDRNRGLGAARNTAVKTATGVFLMHVDSDDYIEKKTVEMCVSRQLETQADIISFGNVKVYSKKNEILLPEYCDDVKKFCLSIISKSQYHNVWGRLIRRSLYTDNNIEVKEGCNIGEDYQVVPVLAYYANKVAAINEPLYHYNMMNVSSYVHSSSLKKVEQSEYSFFVIAEFFRDKGNEYTDALEVGKLKTYVRFLINTLKGNFGKPVYERFRNEICTIPKTKYLCLALPYRILIRLKPYRLAKLYMKIIKIVKR